MGLEGINSRKKFRIEKTHLIFLFGFFLGALVLWSYLSLPQLIGKTTTKKIAYVSPTPTPKKVDVEFTSDNSIYLQYMDKSINLNEISCLNNQYAFHRDDITSDSVKAIIDSLFNRQDSIEDSTYKATLKDIKELVSFEHICLQHSTDVNNQITTYYFLFVPFDGFQGEKLEKFRKKVSLLPKALAAGGASSQPFLAVLQEGQNGQVGNLTISKREITKDITYVSHGIKNGYNQTVQGAYFSCRRIVGVSGANVYLGCGSGDGCCSAFGLSEVNIQTMLGKELFSCINDVDQKEGKNGMRYQCMNNKGVVLEEKFTPYPN